MNIIERDLNHIWHPCSQMKDYETFKPVPIIGAKGSYLELENGEKMIDAISSWWCKSLGHGDPRIKQALINQYDQFEHVILANTTNNTVVRLAERLAKITAPLDKIVFASDGSCAVEIAVKLSVHAHQLRGFKNKNKFAALQNSYHGETCMALGLSDLGLYRSPYNDLLPDVTFIQSIPYVNSRFDPLWSDCSSYWPAIEAQLKPQAESLAAIIVEPIIQGAGGMLIYSADLLKRLSEWAKANNVYLIMDEIFTGFGRAGAELAYQHSGIQPDFVCLGKGLTSGVLPLSAVMTATETYNLFYDDYETGKAFMHSHTHSGNALACACANACLDIYAEDQIYQQLPDLEQQLSKAMLNVAEQTGRLENIRYLGGVVAADLISDPKIKRFGYAVYQEAVKLGALLRPLGNTIYWCPPLNISKQTINDLENITIAAIKKFNS